MAIAIDSTGGGAVDGSTTLTFAFTNTAGTFLTVGASASQTISGITYNGVAMTQAVASADNKTKIFYLASPATGSNNVVVTASTTANILASVVSMTGVAAASFLGNTGTDSAASGANPTYAFTTGTDNSVFIDMQVCGTNANGGAQITATGTGHTKVRSGQQNDLSRMGGYTETTTAGSYTIGWAFAGANDSYSGVNAEFKPAAAASSIKTVDGLAKASVKTVDGLAIASVKTINGLA